MCWYAKELKKHRKACTHLGSCPELEALSKEIDKHEKMARITNTEAILLAVCVSKKADSEKASLIERQYIDVTKFDMIPNPPRDADCPEICPQIWVMAQEIKLYPYPSEPVVASSSSNADISMAAPQTEVDRRAARASAVARGVQAAPAAKRRKSN